MPWAKLRDLLGPRAGALEHGATAAITPSDWSAGVVGTLAGEQAAVAGASTASVKVPPTSTPSGAAAVPCRPRAVASAESTALELTIADTGRVGRSGPASRCWTCVSRLRPDSPRRRGRSADSRSSSSPARDAARRSSRSGAGATGSTRCAPAAAAAGRALAGHRLTMARRAVRSNSAAPDTSSRNSRRHARRCARSQRRHAAQVADREVGPDVVNSVRAGLAKWRRSVTSRSIADSHSLQHELVVGRLLADGAGLHDSGASSR